MEIRVANEVFGKYNVGISHVNIINGEIEIITQPFNSEEIDEVFEDFAWCCSIFILFYFYEYKQFLFKIPTNLIVEVKKTDYNCIKIKISNDFINKNALLE